jgi:hypothetical protein
MAASNLGSKIFTMGCDFIMFLSSEIINLQAQRESVKGVAVSRGPVISEGPAAKRLKIHIIIKWLKSVD